MGQFYYINQKFNKFEDILGQRVFVSATPADYELNLCEGLIVEQVVRPTGLLDPPIEVRPTKNQIDDLLEEIRIRAVKDERVLVTTLTKRMAEELDKYFSHIDIRCRYIHSDVDTMERIEILEDFQAGRFDVLIGVNLLREGLDLPQVSLVAILDADKEGFLRSERSLTQTAGRAARNVDGRVIMYADNITRSMQRTIEETDRRRKKQEEYNRENNIKPTQIEKQIRNVMGRVKEFQQESEATSALLNDPVMAFLKPDQIKEAIAAAKTEMERAAYDLDFIMAAKFRDEMNALRKLLEK